MNHSIHTLFLALLVVLYYHGAATHAATINVAPGTDNLVSALANATNGDVISLAPGEHILSTPRLQVEKGVLFEPSNPNASTVVSFLGAADTENYKGFKLVGEGLNSTFKGFLLKNGAGSCDLETPRPLNATFFLEVETALLQNNTVKLRTTLSSWYHTRQINGISYGSCIVTPTETSPAIIHSKTVLSSVTCKKYLDLHINFARITSCNVQKVTAPRFKSYLADINVNMTEWVPPGNT